MTSILFACCVLAGDPYLPGFCFADSTGLMEPGTAALDVGWNYDEAGDYAGSTAGSLLLYYGLTTGSTVRLGLPGYCRLHGEPANGFGDVLLGWQTSLVEPAGARPAVDLVVDLLVPVNRDLDYGVRPYTQLLAAWSPSARTTLQGSLHFTVPREEGVRYGQFGFGFGVAQALGDQLGVTAEYFGLYPGALGERPQHYLTGGLGLPLGRGLDLQLNGGLSLNGVNGFHTGAIVTWSF